jgi:oligopeptide transport system ATP-binding protein
MKKNELILSVRDLNIKFNLRGKILHAIRGIDLDVYHGEVLAIVGESGSGKSVFTKSFMGLLDSNGSITSGTIDYFGADDHQPIRLSELKKEKDWLKVRGHEIAMIMQDPMTSLNPLKTIGDQIMEAVELHQGLKGAAAREKTLEYLRDVGIADPEVRFKQYPHEFSGGMRQRVVIAQSLASPLAHRVRAGYALAVAVLCEYRLFYIRAGDIAGKYFIDDAGYAVKDIAPIYPLVVVRR